MSSQLKQLQQSFLNYLLGKPSTVITHIQSTVDTSAEQRLGIYASGYRLRLKEALSTDYERLHRYLGDDLFNQLMNAYIDNNKSHHPSLRDYSQHMSELLSTYEPFSNLPELLEIQRIEQAFNLSFDAADCNTITLDDLANLSPVAWPGMQLKFHPSLALLTTQYNTFPIWRALSEEKEPAALEKDATDWVVWRRDLISRYRALPENEAYALKIAVHGGNFSDLCEGLLHYHNEQETPQQAVIFLQTWINEKMVCAIASH